MQLLSAAERKAFDFNAFNTTNSYFVLFSPTYLAVNVKGYLCKYVYLEKPQTCRPSGGVSERNSAASLMITSKKLQSSMAAVLVSAECSSLW